jgi:hypothetical protein
MATNRDVRSLQIIDPVLTNLARRYQPDGFIYDSVIASIPVKTLSGQYPIFTKGFWFANDTDLLVRHRAPAKEIDFEWSTDTYLCQEYAAKTSIDDLERSQADPSLRLEQSKNEFLSLRMSIAREVRLASILHDPVYAPATGQLTSGNSTTPSTKWDVTTSNPEADIRAAALKVYAATGQTPNTIVLPYPVAYNLATIHGADTFRGQMLYTVNGQEAIRVGDGILPSTIHGMKVVIPRGPQVATRSTTDSRPSQEPYGTANYAEIWGKHARLLYAQPGANWGNPSVVYRFQHTPVFTTKWATTDPDVDYVRQWERLVEKVVAPDCGWVLTDVIS